MIKKKKKTYCLGDKKTKNFHEKKVKEHNQLNS